MVVRSATTHITGDAVCLSGGTIASFMEQGQSMVTSSVLNLSQDWLSGPDATLLCGNVQLMSLLPYV